MLMLVDHIHREELIGPVITDMELSCMELMTY